MLRSIGEAAAWHGTQRSAALAIVDSRLRLTHGDLWRRTCRLANALQSLGVAPGDRVALLMYNGREYLEGYQAVGLLGAAAVPLNFRYTAPELEYVLHQSDSKALILGPEFAETLRALGAALPRIAGRCLVTGTEAVADMLSYEAILGHSSEAPPDVTVDVRGCFFQGYTAGTTGFPKGCVNSHEGYVDFFKRIALLYGVTDGDVDLAIAPLFHQAPAICALLQLYVGGTVVVSRRAAPTEILDLIQRERTTWAFMVPTMWQSLVVHGDRHRYDVSSMRVLVSAGQPLLTHTKEGILAYFTGAGLNEFYGTTEAGIVTNLFPDEQRRKVRCAGRPILGYYVKLLGPDGEEVGPGDVGEVYIRGPLLMREYYKNPEATAKAFRGEWITLGDLGRFDGEGYLYIVDRKNDMIITGGEHVFPTEVEDVLTSHPDVRGAAVVGVPHAFWGEAVTALLVLHPDAKASAEELQRYCAERLSGFKVPKRIDFVDELPMSSFGKILRRAVRERYAATMVGRPAS